MFSGEGDDLKPDVLGRWFREVKGYFRRYNMNDTTPNIALWYGDYTTGRAKDAIMALIDKHDEREEELPLTTLKERMTTLFQASTNKDDLWLQWQKVYQTTNGKTKRITAIATELEMIKSHLPTSSVTSFAQRQRLLDAMDNRLRRVVEPQLRDGDTWLTMVEIAERYDATLFKTGAYGRSDNSGSKQHKPSTSKATTKTTTTSKPKSKYVKKTTTKKGKPDKAEMERRKKDGACFYCGETGHVANDCPKKEIRSNKVTAISDIESENEEESEEEEEESSSDEEIYVGYVAYSGKTSTAKTTLSPGLMDSLPQALEAYIYINGYRA